MKIDQHEPQETKVNHNRPKSTATGQGEPQETRVTLVVTMNHSVLFGSLWCFWYWHLWLVFWYTLVTWSDCSQHNMVFVVCHLNSFGTGWLLVNSRGGL